MLTPCESRGANYSELTEHDLARLEGAPRFRVTEFTALIKILREDLIWVEVAKKLGLTRTSPAWNVAQYAFTQMLNNAIDHSRGETVQIAKLYSGNFEFSKSSPMVKLFEIGVEFVSRSEAKRLLAGLDKFSEITSDYKGVEKVGQGFLDEIYRVWQNQNSDIVLRNLNASAGVEFVLKRGGG